MACSQRPILAALGENGRMEKRRGVAEREEREKASKDEKKQARMDAQQRTNRELNWGLC